MQSLNAQNEYINIFNVCNTSTSFDGAGWYLNIVA